MCVCMYICMYACMYAMHVCMCARTHTHQAGKNDFVRRWGHWRILDSSGSLKMKTMEKNKDQKCEGGGGVGWS